jgi:hypothetical protein
MVSQVAVCGGKAFSVRGRTNGESATIVCVEDVLSKSELAALQKKLATMSTTALHDFYFAAYYRCRLQEQAVPSARDIQELVQAWKALRRG